ncbi:anti-repressor SinI family protein [Ammoniphilus sp. CFH 90114]|uniref:anti-repressor SinI family protein n=1 Tax=Ammoniphilus sp. CFH 90114 TaxID=2493665 RepID=UPI00100EB9FD|nr:anti-repressor SinI family protein [Ammoniphilus sp. CFH 90114]RXT04944.1 DNA-binding anti-repressor SinI [Ammoniphilus sp. CFH 90114]
MERKTLEKEWMELVVEAMNANVSKEEFRAFLERKKMQKEEDQRAACLDKM